MKKRILIAVLVMFIAALGSVALHAQENITLTYMTSQGWVFDAEMELGQQFEEQTGIHIDYQVIPSDQYFTVLKTRLNSGEGPDIFGGQSGVSDLVIQYDVEKNAVDLSGEPWPASLIHWLLRNRWSMASCTGLPCGPLQQRPGWSIITRRSLKSMG